MSKFEIPRPLSAKFKEDFAYPTVKDRLPVILTKVVDLVYRLKVETSEKFGEAGVEDLKTINSYLSQLKNELQTDKALKPLTDDWRDAKTWDEYLYSEQEKNKSEGIPPSWFTSPWLYVECFFYRKIHEAIQKSLLLKELDPFAKQKQEAFLSSESAMQSLSTYMYSTLDQRNECNNKSVFLKLLKISLWGNRCDLSISGGTENSQKEDSLAVLDSFESYLLVDHSEKVWNKLQELKEAKSGSVRLDIVLDNAGYELFTDLCLIEYVLSLELISTVFIYPKSFPWFVSDVTQSDLEWTLNKLSTNGDSAMARIGQSLQKRLDDKSLIIYQHDYWTLPYDYPIMINTAPDLYKELAKSDLILFKGDLNYRKLTADRKWNTTTSFDTALQGFQPAALCALRTLKCDLVVGLSPGQAEEAEKRNKNWLVTGDFGVIQLSDLKIS